MKGKKFFQDEKCMYFLLLKRFLEAIEPVIFIHKHLELDK